MKRTVKMILDKKGGQVWSIDPDKSGFEALQILEEKNIGALPVVANGKMLGIFTERDYARKVILKGLSSKETPVGKLMTRNVIHVSPTQTIDVCMGIMTEKHFRHLPVMENDSLVGLISIGDVVRMIISEQKFTIDQLEKYITGSM